MWNIPPAVSVWELYVLKSVLFPPTSSDEHTPVEEDVKNNNSSESSSEGGMIYIYINMSVKAVGVICSTTYNGPEHLPWV